MMSRADPLGDVRDGEPVTDQRLELGQLGGVDGLLGHGPQAGGGQVRASLTGSGHGGRVPRPRGTRPAPRRPGRAAAPAGSDGPSLDSGRGDRRPATPWWARLVGRRYRVLARVARGGMATVYRAEDTRLGRLVALKVMHPHLAESADFVARFHAEARAAASLSHRHVVAVHDAGRGRRRRLAGDGAAARAHPARPAARAGRLQPGRGVRGHAGRAARPGRGARRGPGPPRREARERPARPGRHAGRSPTSGWPGPRPRSRTATGALLGTPEYIAPETARTGQVDERVDVYSAGIMLFELLTGRQPHTGDVPFQVVWAHVTTDVPAPSRWAPALPARGGRAGRRGVRARPGAAHRRRPRSCSRTCAGSGSALDPDVLTPARRPRGPAAAAGRGATARPASSPPGAAAGGAGPRPRRPRTAGRADGDPGGARPRATRRARPGEDRRTVTRLAGVTTAARRPHRGRCRAGRGRATAGPDPTAGTRDGRRGDDDRASSPAGGAAARAWPRSCSCCCSLSVVGRGGAVVDRGGAGGAARGARPARAHRRRPGPSSSRRSASAPRTTPVFDDVAPEGEVVDTRPGPGGTCTRTARSCSSCRAGPELFAVPDVRGLDPDEAAAALEEAGLALGAGHGGLRPPGRGRPGGVGRPGRRAPRCAAAPRSRSCSASARSRSTSPTSPAVTVDEARAALEGVGLRLGEQARGVRRRRGRDRGRAGARRGHPAAGRGGRRRRLARAGARRGARGVRAPLRRRRGRAGGARLRRRAPRARTSSAAWSARTRPRGRCSRPARPSCSRRSEAVAGRDSAAVRRRGPRPAPRTPARRRRRPRPGG